MTGEEFLQSKDIWHHPRLGNRLQDASYDVAELLDEFLKLHTEQNLNKHGIVRGGDKVRESVKRVEEYLQWLKGEDTKTTPTEPLPAEGLDTVAAGGYQCKKCLKSFFIDQPYEFHEHLLECAGSSHDGQP